uniref:NADH dehydrogenase subunit 2 n=1 Tax=Uroobovella oviformis TaxID=3106009 RepID=UPI002E77CB89|nr:NADH dehydrogenase subunit 2 [Uroobovella oviformis]WPV72082.1 NADH dehydrogenase subunit 2 [Uroobovella oviformis]
MLLPMKITSMIMLTFSILLSIFSFNWFQLWISMEINMISFLPLMFNDSKSMNSMLKYFFIQSIASSLFMLFMILFSLFSINIYMIMIMLSMLTKLGMFPIFTWFPQVVSNSNWLTNFILMSVQKLIPINILSMFNHNFMLLSLTLIMSSLISITGMWNQNNLKIVMAFSSMNHMSWIIMPMMFNLSVWFLYFLIYSIIILVMLTFFSYLNINSMMNLKLVKNYYNNLMVLIMFWNLGGLPPLIGFLPKWMVASIMVEKSFSLTMIMMLSSFISLYVYSKIMFPILASSVMILKNSFNLNSFMMSLMIFSTFIIPIMTII